MTTKPNYPSQAQDKYVLRMPDGMRDKIAALAKAAGRTMNAEIVLRLERSITNDQDASAAHASVEDMVQYYVRKQALDAAQAEYDRITEELQAKPMAQLTPNDEAIFRNAMGRLAYARMAMTNSNPSGRRESLPVLDIGDEPLPAAKKPKRKPKS